MRRPLVFLVLMVLLATSSGSAPAPASGPGSAARPESPGGPVEEFRPSTRLPADEAVSFPVDI